MADERRYRRELERLHRKHLRRGTLYELQQSEVSLASFVLNRTRVARLIARSVAAGTYEMAPARIRTLEVNGKRREVFALRLADLLVHGVVANVVAEALAPELSPSLHSYRAGRSWWTAVGGLAAYVRAHRRAEPEVRRRGLYVLRRDIDAYTDSIPVGARSPLWAMLRRLVPPGQRIADWRLVERVVRPEAFVRRGHLFTPVRGVPTGQPISCVLFNLYLSPLDAVLDNIPGAFYARYCDDFVFAHPDPGIVRAADRRCREVLAALSLQLNDSKSQTLYLTAAGRASADWPEARGTTVVPSLGCLIGADGTVALSREKRRRLLRDLRQRAMRVAQARGGGSRESAGPVVCAAINRALGARLDFPQQRSAAWLRRVVTDRRHLKQLDYRIARIVLEAVTGLGGPRAFRQVSYRRIRQEWNLISLCHARNRCGRGPERQTPSRRGSS